MPGRRPRVMALLPVALAALVIALALLQYQWLGQVSEAERRQMRESLERRAQDFGGEFDRELGALYSAFSQVSEDADDGLAVALGARVDTWRSGAAFPDLLEQIYVVTRGAGHDWVLRYSQAERRFVREPWPGVLTPVARRLGDMVREESAAEGQAVVRILTLPGDPVLSDIPALIVWLRPADAPETSSKRTTPLPLRPIPIGPPTDALVRVPLTERALVLRINRDYVTGTVIPALAARHFGSTRPATPASSGTPRALERELREWGGGMRLQVVDATGGVLYTRGLEAGATIEAHQADISLPFFAPRVEGAYPETRSVEWLANPAGASEDRRFNVRVERNEMTLAGDVRDRPLGNAWALRVQHAAGSLDQAVASARRRNLYLSFGILGVLVGAIALVIVNARRAERLAVQQMDFVAAVSHELRTPLTVIRSAADNIVAGLVEDPSQTRRYGELIEREGRRLTDLVEQILAHAGINGHRRAPRLAPTDVGATLASVVEAAAGLASEVGCSIELEVEPGLPHVMIDEPAIRGAVENLVSNALKHAAEGSWVGVSARTRPGDRPVLEIAVADRGPGIASEDRAHVFEPFYRGRLALERQVKGTGLGLSLVKRAVEDMGGTVSAGSAPGGGARFVIHLPVTPA